MSHGTIRSLHHHDSLYTLCGASAQHRHLYNHNSNRSLRVALRCKCLSGFVITSSVMKRRSSDKHSKAPSWFVNTKVYLLLNILVVVEKRETEWTESTSLARQREIKRHEEIDRMIESEREREREREQTQTLNYLSRFIPPSALRLGVRPFFGAQPKMRAANFGFLLNVVAGIQLLSFYIDASCS